MVETNKPYSLQCTFQPKRVLKTKNLETVKCFDIYYRCIDLSKLQKRFVQYTGPFMGKEGDGTFAKLYLLPIALSNTSVSCLITMLLLQLKFHELPPQSDNVHIIHKPTK